MSTANTLEQMGKTSDPTKLRQPLATRLSAKHHARFKAIAAEQKRTPGALAALVLEEWVDAFDAKPKPKR